MQIKKNLSSKKLRKKHRFLLDGFFDENSDERGSRCTLLSRSAVRQTAPVFYIAGGDGSCALPSNKGS